MRADSSKIIKHAGRLSLSISNRIRYFSIRDRLPKTDRNKIRLHLGCGAINAPGFVNIDARPLAHVHFRVRDLRDLNFIPEGSVELVYMCHILEHIPHVDLGSVLSALKRVLCSGGIIRISVPDFDRIMEIYVRSGNDMRSIIGPLMGGQDYAQNFHYSAFNEKYLKNLLGLAGFTSVQRWVASDFGGPSEFDWSGRNFEFEGVSMPISLNLQATG